MRENTWHFPFWVTIHLPADFLISFFLTLIGKDDEHFLRYSLATYFFLLGTLFQSIAYFLNRLFGLGF